MTPKPMVFVGPDRINNVYWLRCPGCGSTYGTLDIKHDPPDLRCPYCVPQFKI